MDRVRSALFSMVGQQLQGIRVIDLFAGTGALGLEALSRGAEHATFVESNPIAIDSIQLNLSKAKLLHKAQIIRSDVFAFLGNPSTPAHLILADPPYHKDSEGADIASKLLLDPRLPQHLRTDGVLALEHHPKNTPSAPSLWHCVDSRSYGASALSFFRASAPDLPE
jgi:16S rRNA (guanine966-N2)-methyltransferase